MKLIVNGNIINVDLSTLHDLMLIMGYGDKKVATAVNEQFVPEKERGAFSLSAGDRVEILGPMQGG